VGTGYSIHISPSPSVKATSHRHFHGPAFRQYVIPRGRRTRVPLVHLAQLR
jgi:hypothetical protein